MAKAEEIGGKSLKVSELV